MSACSVCDCWPRTHGHDDPHHPDCPRKLAEAAQQAAEPEAASGEERAWTD